MSTKSNQDFKTLFDAGFSSVLQSYKNHSGAERKEVQKGIGDDAAVIKMDDRDEYLLSTSEIFLEGVHFDLVYTPLHHLGFKIMTAGVSDILAMNGEPLYASVDVAIPNKISVDMLEQIYKGLNTAAKEYGVTITGGDTTPSHQSLVLSIHVTGKATADNIVYRTGSNPEDTICVTGDLGGAMAGLRVLLREKKAWEETQEQHFQPDLEGYEYVIQRQLRPLARKDFPEALKKAGVKPTALIDITQGLFNEIQILCDLNDTGCEIFGPAIPIALETRHVADEMKEDVDRYAYYGGEDFELLFTLHDKDVEKLKTEFEDFSVIGKLQSKKEGIIIHSGEGRTERLDSPPRE
ncbi:MAG: thiamine-phosphate kinase [Balneolaceae bacterium]